MLDGREILLNQFKIAHRIVQQVVADCSPETLARTVDGATIASIGAIYAHIVFDEDIFVQRVSLGGTPLFVAPEWAGTIGVVPGEGIKQSPEWSSRVRLDLAAFTPYATAVFAATESFLESATEDELTKDAQSEVGPTTPLRLLSVAGLTHLSGHMSEIAALKGVFGLKGLPF